MAGAQPQMDGGRADFLPDEDYFMAVAFLAAQRSKDPSTQVGACIVNQDGKVVGTGYNCMPNGCEGQLPWARTADSKLNTKYPYVCHAVLNAFMDTVSADVKEGTIYVSVIPCNDCAKIIIQSGLKKLVHYSDKYCKEEQIIASKELLKVAGVKTELFKLKSNKTGIDIDFESINRPPPS